MQDIRGLRQPQLTVNSPNSLLTFWTRLPLSIIVYGPNGIHVAGINLQSLFDSPLFVYG